MKKILMLLAFLFATFSVARAGSNPQFDAKGNLVVVDQYNNRIVELDPLTHTIVWQYEVSISKTTTNWLVGPRDAERYKGKTLIVAGDLPAGVSSNYPAGNIASRVFEVDKKGKIKWEYGQTSLTSEGEHDLSNPAMAVYAPHKCVLIADQGNHRVIHVGQQGKKKVEIKWQYGTTGVSGVGSNQLDSPASVQRLGNGNYLIADTGNNRVIEVTRKKSEIVWQYGNPADTNILNGPTYACHLKGDRVLITDSGNDRILVVDSTGSNVFTYVTSALPGSVEHPYPTHALPLKSGNFLITDQFNHQIIEVNPLGVVVNSHGTIGTPGSDPGFFYAPADAKVVDDFTGLTAPKESGGGGFSYPVSPF